MTATRTTLLALHGYTLNGAQMRAQMGGLADALAAHCELLCPDAPSLCEPESVARFYKSSGFRQTPPPHRTWWDASGDGTVYQGWEAAAEGLGALLRAADGDVGVLGFSQGAMAAALLAALSVRGDVPRLRFAILLAGMPPRATDLQPLFAEPLPVPSLHIWGQADRMGTAMAPLLVERFAPADREVVVWPGGHTIPTGPTGPLGGPGGGPADAIVDFVRRRSSPPAPSGPPGAGEA